jgi:hypothetical protein
MWKRVVVAGVVAVCALAGSWPASAAAPVTTKEDFVSTDTSNLCGFPLMFTFEGTATERDFTDGQGNPTRSQFFGSDVVTVTNPVTGKTLSGHEVTKVQFDFRRGTAMQVGVAFHVNRPGGTVLIDVGRDSINFNTGETRTVGKHQLLEGDIAEFCAALS